MTILTHIYSYIVFIDIAIGAYKSGHAVILRGKPIVNLKHTLTSSISQVQATDQFSFNVSSCIAFSGINIIPPISKLYYWHLEIIFSLNKTSF